MSKKNDGVDWEVLEAHLPELVTAMEERVPYASVLVATTKGLTIRVNHREQEVHMADPRQGAVLSAWCGDHMEEQATAHLDLHHLAEAAAELTREVQVRPGGLPVDPGEPLRARFATALGVDPRSVPLAEKFERFRTAQRQLAGLDPRVINAEVRYTETHEQRFFANRTRLLRQEIHRIRCFLLLVVHEEGKTAYNWHMSDGTGGLEIAEVPPEKIEELRDVAVGLLKARRVEPGYYDCVATPSVAGTIAHEAFGHGVEMDMFLKGRARAADYVGKMVASPLVSILEDPTVEGAYGSYFVDDEGQLASPTYIIRDGVFERGITDLYSATRLGLPRTANGRREAFTNKVYPPDVQHLFRPGGNAGGGNHRFCGSRFLPGPHLQRHGGPQELGPPGHGSRRARDCKREVHRPTFLPGGHHRLRARGVAEHLPGGGRLCPFRRVVWQGA